MRNLIIIGSGPAGLTAGIYAARAGLKPLVIEGMQSGGQLTQTFDVENFPGFAEPVSGGDLMNSMRMQAERCGVEFMMDEVQGVKLAGKVKVLETMMNGNLEARTVILCTGASARWTNLPGEAKYRSRGISACATCDGAFFRSQDVVVIGGGDTAVGEAVYLAGLCRSVTLIHRRDEFRAAKVLVERAENTDNLTMLRNTVPEEFLGDGKRLNAVRVRNVSDGAVSEIPCSGAFVAIGHEPNTKFLASEIEVDKNGYIVTKNTHTNIEGVFAAGDVTDPYYKQAIIAAGSGAIAAIEAEKFISSVN